jgi:polyisoprenoid-binding protein YceI
MSGLRGAAPAGLSIRCCSAWPKTTKWKSSVSITKTPAKPAANSCKPTAIFIAGVASVWPTLSLVTFQEDHLGLSENAPFPHNLWYFFGGIGLREELCKLLLFVPFLPWLLKIRKPGYALLTGAFVGLGFALEENLNYYDQSGGSVVIGRFITANFMHVALTGIAAHGLYITVRSGFTRVADFAGSFVIDGADVSRSSATLTIQAGSIDTSNADRDGHMKSADFLDTDQFGEITFVSTSASAKGDDVIVTGDLTIHGVTKSVAVTFEYNGTALDPWGNTRVGLEGKAEISRKDFGLVWNAVLEGGGVLVGDTVKLEFDVEAVKA